MRLPIRTRLTLVFAGLMLVVLAGSGVMLYVGLASQIDAAIDTDLRELAADLATDISDGETGDILDDVGIVEAERSVAQILDRDGAILETSRTVADPTLPLVDTSDLRALDAPRFLEGTVRTHEHPEPEPARFLVTPTPEGPVLVVAAELEERNAALEGLAAMLWLGGPVLFVVVSGLAWILSGAALRPVERIRQETSAISEGDLEKRLQVPATGDEIARLATTLNDMLARIEQAFERERRFVDDASHELRTPLGILKTELELALRRSRTPEELRAALASAAEVSERLNRLAEDLLVLARSDRGRLPLHRTRADASTIVLKAIEFFQRRACERGIAIDVSVPSGLEVDVDRLRIEQALGNLVDNALAHTPDGGSIRVTVAVDATGELVISVADTGGGFPETFIDRAFDPFTRADAGRSRRDGGAGLGLAIVKGVTEAHGGTVKAGNQLEGGAIVTLRIPA